MKERIIHKQARESIGFSDKYLEALAKFFMELHTERDLNYAAKYQKEVVCKQPCPKCGIEMELKAKKSSNPVELFWGCKAYPNCKGSRSFEHSN